MQVDSSFRTAVGIEPRIVTVSAIAARPQRFRHRDFLLDVASHPSIETLDVFGLFAGLFCRQITEEVRVQSVDGMQISARSSVSTLMATWPKIASS
jgi:hypothetical protein